MDKNNLRKVVAVVGARPNFIKIDPILRAFAEAGETVDTVLVHTGQHFDDRMSGIFFRELELRPPDIRFDVSPGTHAEQTATIMIAVEKVLAEQRPDLVIVVGDVNSTMAATIAAAKMSVPVAHVEAGLRSFDRRMPEEINRIVTDSLSTYLFTTSHDANRNLRAEGIPRSRVHLVGNVMIDTLLRLQERAEESLVLNEVGVTSGQYILLTLHRAGNVDVPKRLSGFMKALETIQEHIKVVFPIHPRTEKQLERMGYLSGLHRLRNIVLLPPVGYLDFVKLEKHARLVMTDSGGVQEETTVLGVPCLTLRDSTERPVTVKHGTNKIIGYETEAIVAATLRALKTDSTPRRLPAFWDGRTAERIVNILLSQAH